MYFVLRETIVNPETQEPIAKRGAIIRQSMIDRLWHHFGVDSLNCYACFTRAAAETESKRVANTPA